MTTSIKKPSTVAEYLASLPADRRAAIEAVRSVILKNLDKDYQEGMAYGMIGYSVPHSVFPAGYHCDPSQPLMFAALASQKGYMSLYLMCIYGDTEHQAWFTQAWAKTGKKLNMGKSCVRFKKIEDVPLDVVGEAIRRVPAKKYVARYVEILGDRSVAKKASSKAGAKSGSKSGSKIVKKATKKVTKKTTEKAAKRVAARTR